MVKHRSDSPSNSRASTADAIIRALFTQVEAGRKLLASARQLPPGDESSKRCVAYAIRTLAFAEAQMSKLNTFPSRLKLIKKEVDLLQLEIDELPEEYRPSVGVGPKGVTTKKGRPSEAL
jgi:hypothetical protein